MAEPQFRHEDVAAIPSGYRVATVPSGEHLLHIAFPPGRRRKGSGVLTAILHPRGENPCQLANPPKDRIAWTEEIVSGIQADFDSMLRSGYSREDAKKLALEKSIAGAQARAEFLRRIGNPSKREAQRAARERAQRIRGARLNPGPQGHKKTCKCFACKHARRRNPDDLFQAEDLYREFHGKEPSEIIEIQESAVERKDYTSLGDLVELVILTPGGDKVKMSFKRDGVKLASSPKGKQLYLIGGGQNISDSLWLFGADKSKDVADLGEAVSIVYEAGKWQTNHDVIEWKHDFGEESGVRPRLFFDRLKKRIFFAGGNYRVERPGIID